MPARARRQPLPEPVQDVAVRELPSRRIAAVRFSGENGDDAIEAHEADLRRWMQAQGLRAAGPAELAFYNSPLTPAALRRSEVLIPLAA